MTPDARLPDLDFLTHLMIVFEERILRRQRRLLAGIAEDADIIAVILLLRFVAAHRQQIIFHERRADEDFRSFHRIDVAVGNLGLVNFEAVECDLFFHEHIARRDTPVWIVMRSFTKMRRQLDDP